MTDTAPNYRLWRSPGSVLIQTKSGLVELSVADAIAIAAEIIAGLTSTRTTRKSRAATGAPEFLTECVRLYVDENLGLTLTARHLGVSTFTVRSRLIRAGVQLRAMPHSLRDTRAARRAA